MKVLEVIFVSVLFLMYQGLWKYKKHKQLKVYGTDPEVMAASSSAVQRYMSHFTYVMTMYAVIIMVLHSLGLQFGTLFIRFSILDSMAFDISGFITGIAGLSLCFYSQTKMGDSWRVGIDEKAKTELITTGLYSYIRNPTYLGLFLLNIGVWLIWPTWTIFILNLVFVLFLEIQVRCEEDYLQKVHGMKYLQYKSRTKRYIPFIY
jgi:protein-S-isoprenylcysteine O-methyltransferase Ste14